MSLYFEIEKESGNVEDRGDRYRIRIRNPEFFMLMLLKSMANPDIRYDRTESGDYVGTPYRGDIDE